MYFLRPERAPGEKTGAPALPNRLLPFSFHFFRQFFWGCMGLLTLPVLGRAVFASIAYATKRLTDTVLAMHDPAAEAGPMRSEEHTSELQSQSNLVCRLLLEKKKTSSYPTTSLSSSVPLCR